MSWVGSRQMEAYQHKTDYLTIVLNRFINIQFVNP
jgi:hypothetical protein